MSDTHYLETHREWEEWAAMALGLTIGASPWLAGQSHPTIIALNCLMLGTVLIGVGRWELIRRQRRQPLIELACGFWLVVSPWALNYWADGALRFWHSSLAGLVILLAALKLWQDWDWRDDFAAG